MDGGSSYEPLVERWPYEGNGRAKASTKMRRNARDKHPQDFLRGVRKEPKPIVIRIGLNDAQLVLVDGRGFWDRWVYHSVDEAKEIADGLGVPVHEGEYPEKTRVRINGYRRPAEDYERAAYPEQGEVGPVIPYPENRPRELPDAL